MKILKLSILYFIIVFGAGFILGPIRLLLLVPRVGMRIAELIEMPIMLVVIIFAAQSIVRREDDLAVSHHLAVGGLALLLMLIAEFSLVLWLRGITLKEYFATRDAVSGTVYYLMLIIFALLPTIMKRRATEKRN